MDSDRRKKIKAAFTKFPATRILVIGDIIIDHFIWGSVSRISPEAPVPVVNVTGENLLLGGAANVLNNIYALGGEATLCGLIGRDIMGDHLLELIERLNSSTAGIIRSANRPTTKKTRIIAQHQQVVRFDREKTGPLQKEDLETMLTFLAENISSFQAVIVSDYNKGIVSGELMAALKKIVGKHPEIPVIVDPKPKCIERFSGATILTPNSHEAELMAGLEIRDEQSLAGAAALIQNKLKVDAILITRGEAGMALFEKGKTPFLIPTVAKEVFDVTGAGDTVIASLALARAAGLSLEEAAIVANQAAGIVVGKLGTATVTRAEILGTLR
ncbi:MAG: D-glycero-beta-D-manno-heptose-7-phosphate kinase [Desulfurivibrionaceae bacterium]|nr:D-glycero-beta-D-manno-heptose-7-phosphate kinase [Desulfobulbales bacterium]MDT8334311.1 D-glycero-beta-D-manno-heptose-7-phosphate kinase [Desulfurivibrionaceae bacterium]